MTKCKMVVALVHAPFEEGRLIEEATWQAVVLTPKGGGDYLGICLLEVVWKVVLVIINRRFIASITFHVVLHGFQAGCRMGTASLEAKLLQKLSAMREEDLFTIFPDLHKAYDALERDTCLEILEGYRVEPRAGHIL